MKRMTWIPGNEGQKRGIWDREGGESWPSVVDDAEDVQTAILLGISGATFCIPAAFAKFYTLECTSAVFQAGR